MAISGPGKTSLAPWGGPTQFLLDGDYSKAEVVTAVELVVSAIVGGANLSGLAYAVFDGYDIGTASIVTQGNGETTDGSGTLEIDVTGLMSENDPATIIITSYTGTPVATDRGAVCHSTVTVT